MCVCARYLRFFSTTSINLKLAKLSACRHPHLTHTHTHSSIEPDTLNWISTGTHSSGGHSRCRQLLASFSLQLERKTLQLSQKVANISRQFGNGEWIERERMVEYSLAGEWVNHIETRPGGGAGGCRLLLTRGRGSHGLLTLKWKKGEEQTTRVCVSYHSVNLSIRPVSQLFTNLAQNVEM